MPISYPDVLKLKTEISNYNELMLKRAREGNPIPRSEVTAKLSSLQNQAQLRQDKATANKKSIKKGTERKIMQIGRERDKTISGVQNWFKMNDALLPPIFPLLMGLIVFVSRFIREREGISKTRMR